MSKHTLEEIKQKIEKGRQQDAQRAADLEQLQDQIAELDEKINAALNENQTGTAESLIAEQNGLKQRIPTLERIAQYKSDPIAYMPELIEICRENVSSVQPKVNKAVAELDKAYDEYLRKKIALVKLLYNAAEYRCECATLAGMTGITWKPKYFNQFPCVEYDDYKAFAAKDWAEKDYILEMEPEYYTQLYFAREYGNPK